MTRKLSGLVVVMMIIAVAGTRVFADSASEGDRLAQEGNNFAAVASYEKALKDNPSDKELLLKLAELCDNMKWYGRAVQYWEDILEADPGGDHEKKAKERSAFAHRWIGVLFYETGDELDRVLEHLDKAVAHDPGYFDALYWKGRILFETGKFNEAAEILEEAIKAAPQGNKLAAWLLEESRGAGAHGEAYTIYSGAYKHFEKDEFSKALEMYEKAAELNPDFARPLEYIARIYMAQGKYEEAAGYWDKVLEKEPDNKRAEWFKKVAVKEMKNSQD